MKQEYSIKPVTLELKFTDQERELINEAFTQNERLIGFLGNYYSNVKYGELVERKFNFSKEERDKVIYPFCVNAKINLIKETIVCQIDKVLETFKGNYNLNHSKPHFDNLRNKMRIRVSNSNHGVKRTRQLTLSLESNDAALFCKLSLTKEYKLRCFIGLLSDNFDDKFLCQEVVNAIRGIDGYKVGDPSEIFKTEDNRYFLNLLVEKKVMSKKDINNTNFEEYKTGHIMGIDLNMSKNIGVAVVLNNQQKVIGVEKVAANNIMRTCLNEKKKQAAYSRSYTKITRGGKPYARYEKGQRVGRRTTLDKSLLEMQYKYLTYNCVNRMISLAIKYGVKIIRIENISGFKKKIQWYSRQRKFWGRTFHISKNCNTSAGRNYSRYLYLTKIAAIFKYGVFKEDLENTARNHGISVDVISAFNTSRTCYKCGHIAKGNRPDRDSFYCLECGYRDASDFVAAVNIARNSASKIKGKAY